MLEITAGLLTRLKRVARFLVNEGCNLPAACYLWGAMHEARGNWPAAAAAYQRALDRADASRNRRMFRVRQRWQFRLEHAWQSQGAPRVHDPLFACMLSPAPDATPCNARRSPGRFEAQWEARGLRIDGFLGPFERPGVLRVMLGDRVLRSLPCSRIFPLPPFFQLTLLRATLDAMPVHSRLRLLCEDGRALLCQGSEALDLTVPHGDGSLVLRGSDDMAVDKKGVLIAQDGDLDRHRAQLLETYARARTAFDTLIGTPLLLAYGTLLGFRRQGDFIPGDDDFDVAYVSRKAAVAEVKREAMDIVERLVIAGFTVAFNPAGRLFRLRLPGNPASVHLDVHCIWQEHGALWIHPKARLHCTPEDFLPAAPAVFRGVAVWLPRVPEAFLQAYYGASWRTPDPAYSTNSRGFALRHHRYLARAFVSPSDYAQMRARIAAAAGDGARGALISMGSHSLYPLERYHQECER